MEKEPYVSIKVDSDDQLLVNAVSASILSGLKRDGFTYIEVCVEESILTGKEDGTHRNLHKPESLLDAMKLSNPEVFGACVALHVQDVRPSSGVIEYRFDIDKDGNARDAIGDHDLLEDE